jgi:galactonate dehydratase
MRVTAVETIMDPAHHPALLWVRIHTDEGLIGTGETAGLAGAAGRVVHDLLADVLIGEEPTRIEHCWQRGFRAISYYGAGGAELRALSAVDFALWDLLGKAADMPLYALLGGPSRDTIPIYNTCGNYGEIRDRDAFLENPVSLAHDLLAEGIGMVKVWPFDNLAQRSGGQSITSLELERGAACIAALRDASERRLEVALEGHGFWNLPSAVRIARAVEPYDPIWIEDLIPPDNIDALVALRRKTRVPVIASERLVTRFRFAELVRQGAADILMPDLAWCGGISEGVKIAALAGAEQLPIAPHNCGGPLTHVVTAHFCAHIPNLLAMETIRAFYYGYYDEYITELPLPDDGALPLPPGPGIGAELRPEVLERSDLIREVTTEAGLTTVAAAQGDPWSTMRF